MKRVFFAIVGVAFIASCSTKEIIPEKDMVDVLVKSFLTDATVISPHLNRPLSKLDTINYYAWAFEQMGYSEEQFEKSLDFYTKNPDLLDKILDKVINELSRIEMETGTNLITPEEANAETTPNLWTEKTSWYLPNDGSQQAVNFKIPTVGPGIYTVSAEVRVFSDDGSKNPRMTAFFYFDDGSQHGNRTNIKSVSYQKDGETRVVSIENTLKNPEVTHVMGWVMDHSGQEGSWSKHAEITNITLHYKPLPPPIEIKKGFPRLSKNSDKKDVTE